MVTFQIDINLEGDHTPNGPTFGGPNTGSTVAVALLGSPAENVAKVGTILPLPYQALCEGLGKYDQIMRPILNEYGSYCDINQVNQVVHVALPIYRNYHSSYDGISWYRQ